METTKPIEKVVIIEAIEEKIKNAKELRLEVFTITLKNGKKCLVESPKMDEVAIYQSAMTMFMIMKDNLALLNGGIQILERLWVWGEFNLKQKNVLIESEEVKEAALSILDIVKPHIADVKKN